MINIKRKEDCCGCGACYDACAKNAIVWETDIEGFSYPHVDIDKCVNCGMCNKACPIENAERLNSLNKEFIPKVFACYHKNDKTRFYSTSGGAFWGLAESFVKSGGYVCGAVFTEEFKVRHIVTNDIVELERIRGSKYVQSDCRGMYDQIQHLLLNNEKVMATGLPCQMAALRQYLRKNYENLIVIDLICHSVTSPLVFEKYKNYLEQEYGAPMVKYHPKNKEMGGWHNFSFKAEFANGKIYHRQTTRDYYTKIAYGSSIMARWSCFKCRFKQVPQASDITIGDFWGIEKIDPEWDSPNGVSKVVLNTPKGKAYFDSLDCFVSKEYDIQTSIYLNPRSWSMIRSPKICDVKKRESFVTDLKTLPFEVCMKKHFTISVTARIINKIKNLIKIICRVK